MSTGTTPTSDGAASPTNPVGEDAPQRPVGTGRSGPGGASLLPQDIDDDGRGESRNQRLDRNWQELLQELRVMQTGIQILTGFLLTLPFQSRFDELDEVQVTVYLCLVCLSALITALVLSSVNMHRVLFGLRVKATLVQHTAAIIRATTALVGLVLAGTAWLIFDLVVNRAAGLIVAGALLLVVVLLWVVYPLVVRRRALRNRA